MARFILIGPTTGNARWLWRAVEQCDLLCIARFSFASSILPSSALGGRQCTAEKLLWLSDGTWLPIMESN